MYYYLEWHIKFKKYGIFLILFTTQIAVTKQKKMFRLKVKINILQNTTYNITDYFSFDLPPKKPFYQMPSKYGLPWFVRTTGCYFSRILVIPAHIVNVMFTMLLKKKINSQLITCNIMHALIFCKLSAICGNTFWVLLTSVNLLIIFPLFISQIKTPFFAVAPQMQFTSPIKQFLS